MDTDVVILGAGAAGLAAARRLASRSVRTIVLEARDRVGGRVRWETSSRAVVPMELGAEFIHGPAHQTMTLLREIGGAAFDTVGQSWTFDGGRLEPQERDMIEAASLIERVQALPGDLSIDAFLRPFENDPATREAAAGARAFVEGFEAADPALASTRAIAEELGSGVDSISARPIGGYAPLIEHLHSACIAAGVAIHLSTVVRRVVWRRGEVTVDVDGPGGRRSIRARAAIVTLPAGVLRHAGNDNAIVFSPELPARKQHALSKIEMGTVFKVVLRFRTAFWEQLDNGRYRDAAFFRAQGSAFSAYWTQYPLRGEVVVAWVGGPKAAALNGSSMDDIVTAALEGFGRLMGDAALVRTQFEGGFVHDWDGDPFARGAYSYVAVGGADARVVLGEPVDGTLFFAGEATSTDGQGGTVNGALETGERAAKQAAAALER